MDPVISWLESHMQPCVYKKFIGIQCPGCGMQRALIELLKGNILESILIYPALIPILFMIIYLLLHLIFKFKKGANILKYTFIINSTIIVVNYLVNQILYGIH
jgi:hypothetical protein